MIRKGWLGYGFVEVVRDGSSLYLLDYNDYNDYNIPSDMASCCILSIRADSTASDKRACAAD